MEDEIDFSRLSLEELCTHKKSWKARKQGYEQAEKLFLTCDSETSQAVSRFAYLLKDIAGDANVVALDKGLDAVLAFVDNASIAPKTANDVCTPLVMKCLASVKQNVQKKAREILLLYCEIGRGDVVQDELIKGLQQKNPKAIVGCLKAITECLKEFGSGVLTVKPLVKPIVTLLEDRDKTVRDESKSLVVEMYRWAGPAFRPLPSSTWLVKHDALWARRSW